MLHGSFLLALYSIHGSVYTSVLLYCLLFRSVLIVLSSISLILSSVSSTPLLNPATKHLSSGSVQFSRSVVSDSLRPHESQHTRPPCPSPTPRVYPNPCPSSRRCHPAISSSVVPFSSCPQSLPADTTLMAESEEELKRLLMKVKDESEKIGLKFNIQKTKIMASGPITSWEIDGETVETVSDFFWGGLQNHCRW